MTAPGQALPDDSDALAFWKATVPADAEALLALMTRQQLINLCYWNDRNGVWTDAQCKAEGMRPASAMALRAHVRNWLNDIAPAADPCVELCTWLHRAGIVVLP